LIARADVGMNRPQLVPDEHRYAAVVDVLGRQPAEAWPLFAVALHAQATDRLVRGATT
jgi:hypothetical protein